MDFGFASVDPITLALYIMAFMGAIWGAIICHTAIPGTSNLKRTALLMLAVVAVVACLSPTEGSRRGLR